MTLKRGMAAVLAVTGVVGVAAACGSSGSGGSQGSQGSNNAGGGAATSAVGSASSSGSAGSSSSPSAASASGTAGSSGSSGAPSTSTAPSSSATAKSVDLCGSFTPADMTKAVGETFLTCKQTVTTDAVSPNHITTVAVYSESDDLRIFTVSYSTNAAHALQTYHADTKVTGLGDAAWFGPVGFDLQVAYGQSVLTTRVGMRGMGGGDVLAVDKKVTNAVVGKLGMGG